MREEEKNQYVHKDPPTEKYFKKLELEDQEDNEDKLEDYDLPKCIETDVALYRTFCEKVSIIPPAIKWERYLIETEGVAIPEEAEGKTDFEKKVG